ncbi:hypothetical protein HELRODRAFT_191647 [Helobdella robusta]|uniref:Uncharacterized protein n=1 Tax=Helobdella robusta TaxID=6412 RepID=T1FT62_HELRO|nr:hypothetical protein HELRODRAFT_191647 [Helobdella robusta]ESO04606.1 hypothetical protein HELRODRAFT_191647 [Helobdella robusta]
MERWVIKVFTLMGTFLLPLFSTLLPYRLSHCIDQRGQAGKRILSYLMCFGGGIFFGTYLLHMGPEVRMLLHESLLKPYNIDYPLSDLFTGIGFFVVLFAEKIVLRCNKKRLEHKRQSMYINETEEIREWTPPPGHVCANPTDTCQPCIMGLPCIGRDGKVIHEIDDDGNLRPISGAHVEGLTMMTALKNKHDDTNYSRDGSGDGSTGDNYESKSREKQVFSTSKTSDGDFSADSNHRYQRRSSLKTRPELHRRERKISEVASLNGFGQNEHTHTSTRSIILILALSLHRIFEGMSVGLQKSTQDVLNLFLAVMCHETVIGFSLGLQFVKSKFPLRRLVVTSLVCSIIMPVGVAIGTVMTEIGHQSQELDISNGVLQAFAMGTFIYVTFFEILQEEIDPEDTSIGKVIFIALGFSMMALLTLIPEEHVSEISELGTPSNSTENITNALLSNMTSFYSTNH